MTSPTLRTPTIIACVCGLLCCAGAPSAQPARQGGPPKLIVILVIDQMRGDYLEWYGSRFTSGLRRLVHDGAWFTEAAYPYLNTVTCAGHSTIGTGTFPYRHGMILNNWLDRETGKSPYCTDDPAVTEISYNQLSPVQGDSAKRLLVPALGEQLMARGGRSVALSLKPRSAVTLTGRRATAVVWFDDRGGWTTSTAFTPTPVPYIQAFIDASPITNDADKIWDRALPASEYQGDDDGRGEGVLSGRTRLFPYALGSKDGKIDAGFFSRWQRSPYADEYLGRMAVASIDALKLGRGEATDFLGVSFSGVDGVGHLYGPRSHEVQDMLVRLDRTIGQLLAYLDTAVGEGNYVVGLSSDHGVAEIPEQSGKGGRVTSRAITDAIESVLVPALGPGTHVAASAYTNIYLTEPARKRLARDETLRAQVLAAIRSVQGIQYSFWGPDLVKRGARQSSDAVKRAAALSHHPDRSGDLIVAPGENWLLSTSVTTHGTHYPYDQRVPVILFGPTIRAGRYTQPATPADIAPTLAAVARVKIAPTDGRVLKEALQQPTWP